MLKTGITVDIVTGHNLKDLMAYIQMCITDIPFCFLSIEEVEKPTIYDSWAEIDRMRVDFNNYSIAKNSNGCLCSTYPFYFVILFKTQLIPKNYSKDTL